MKKKPNKPVSYAEAGEQPPPALHDTFSLAASQAKPGEGEAMVRTQIYLTRREHEFLQAEARRQNGSLAGVLRAMVEERMRVPEEAWDNNPLLAPPADPSFTGPEDSVLNLDHYLYGGPKKWIKRGGQWVEAPPLPADYHTNPRSTEAYDQMVRGMDESQGAA